MSRFCVCPTMGRGLVVVEAKEDSYEGQGGSCAARTWPQADFEDLYFTGRNEIVLKNPSHIMWFAGLERELL